MRKVGYRGTNILDAVVFVKDQSELAIDLAFSAVLFGNEELAQEVMEIEQQVEDARYDARIALMLAAKRADDAERLVGVFNVLDGGVKIAGAAADIAQVVLHDVGLPPEIRHVLPEAREVTGRAVVAQDSPLAGHTLAELDLERDPGVHVVALRRETTWIRRPSPDEQVLEGDVLVFAGPEEPVRTLHERATGEPPEAPAETAARDIPGLEEAVDAIVRMKDLAELGIGLAYTASLYDLEAVAGEVSVIERRSDELETRLEDWVLDAAGDLDEPSRLRGLLHLASASEAITDAALQIAEVVLRDVDMPALYAEALENAEEIITSVTVDADSELATVTVEELITGQHTGMVVLAVRRDDDWIYDPDPSLALAPGDVLYARGPPEGEERLRQQAAG